jgi:hypothetical protein
LGGLPRLLIFNAGEKWDGDLVDHMSSFGWASCSCDARQEPFTDFLNQDVRRAILEDIGQGHFDAVFMSSPYDTRLERDHAGLALYAPQELSGVRAGLTAAEKKKLDDGNAHTAHGEGDAGLPFIIRALRFGRAGAGAPRFHL